MIIIIGASKGIGRFLYTCFKNLGSKVIGTYNSTVLGLEDDIDNYFFLNILDINCIRSFVSRIDSFSNIVLINCAGITYNSFAHKSDVEIWDNVIDVNVKGTFHVIRELLPIMRRQNYGRIINFASVVTKKKTNNGCKCLCYVKSRFNWFDKVIGYRKWFKGYNCQCN